MTTIWSGNKWWDMCVMEKTWCKEETIPCWLVCKKFTALFLKMLLSLLLPGRQFCIWRNIKNNSIKTWRNLQLLQKLKFYRKNLISEKSEWASHAKTQQHMNNASKVFTNHGMNEFIESSRSCIESDLLTIAVVAIRNIPFELVWDFH